MFKIFKCTMQHLIFKFNILVTFVVLIQFKVLTLSFKVLQLQ